MVVSNVIGVFLHNGCRHQARARARIDRDVHGYDRAGLEDDSKRQRRRGDHSEKSPSSRRRAPNPGLIARDQIARMQQAALECREAEHASYVCTATRMSIISSSATGSLRLRRTLAHALNPVPFPHRE
jgi:hypothetical protein